MGPFQCPEALRRKETNEKGVSKGGGMNLEHKDNTEQKIRKGLGQNNSKQSTKYRKTKEGKVRDHE